MKKIIAVFMLALVLCTALPLASFAEEPPVAVETDVAEEPSVAVETDVEDTYCTVNGKFESVSYFGKKYLPYDLEGNIDHSGVQNQHRVKFASKEDAEYFDDVYVYYPAEYPYVIVASYEYGDRYQTSYFVEESHYDEVKRVVEGEDVSGYVTESYYSYAVGDRFLKAEEVSDWLATGDGIIMKAEEFVYHDSYELYATDSGGAIRREIGMILRVTDYSVGADSYYLIYYPEYDRSYFYADGRFALDSDVEATFYLLTDATLAAELSAYYDTLPEDELGWMVDTAMPKGVFYTLMTVIFVGLPVAAIIFSLVVTVKRGQKNPYRAALITLMISSAVVVIGYLTLMMKLI